MRLDCVIGLGSNLGDRARTLEGAVAAIAELGALRAVSSVYETAPVGPPQPEYLNAAVRLETELLPERLLDELLEIERRAGRERRVRWGARTLDLDILWISGMVVETSRLTVPHSELSARAFALVPLLEVAPEATDPRTGTRYSDVLTRLGGPVLRRTGTSLVRGSVPVGQVS